RPKSKERTLKRSADREDERRKRSPDRNRRSADRNRSSRSRSRSAGSRERRRERREKERSATPKPVRIHIGRLTRNVTKEHVIEIFENFGKIKLIEFPFDRFHPTINRGIAYVEYHTAEEAEKAMKHMDGGQIDGQEISCAPVMRNQGRPPAPIGRGRSPIRGGGRGPPMGGGGRWRSPGPKDSGELCTISSLSGRTNANANILSILS
uniref:RRM domain-containing protein n=1 Tax=Megaselia scalaris TaxID=36166 RepID=T1GMK1_MEGSC